MDTARTAIAGNRSPSKLGGRFWELSGALMRCGVYKRAMEPVDRYYKSRSGKKGVISYYRCREANLRKETCPNNKTIRPDKAHPEVWDLVSGLLSEPERLRKGLDAMIEEPRGALRSDPELEAKAWLVRLAALDRKRGGYLDLAAEGIMDRDELRAKLAELQENRETAEREIAAIEGHREQLEQIERDRDTIMEHYAGTVPESLDDLSPEERHKIYKKLRLEVLAYPDKSLEVRGAILAGGAQNEEGGLGALELTRIRESKNTQSPGLCFHALLTEGNDPRVQLHSPEVRPWCSYELRPNGVLGSCTRPCTPSHWGR